MIVRLFLAVVVVYWIVACTLLATAPQPYPTERGTVAYR